MKRKNSNPNTAIKSESELPEISAEFIKENTQLGKTIQKSGGPYSKKDRFNRRQEVYRLHFDLGMPAVKIAELMKINRNTINNDIRFWYAKLAREWQEHDINAWLMRQIHRLEIQRTRLRDELEKEHDAEIRISIERLLLEIENRITHTLVNSAQKEDLIIQHSLQMLNDWAEENKLEERFIDRWSLLKIKSNQYIRIMDILKHR